MSWSDRNWLFSQLCALSQVQSISTWFTILCVRLPARMSVSMNVCMYACMYAYIYTCRYTYMYIFNVAKSVCLSICFSFSVILLRLSVCVSNKPWGQSTVARPLYNSAVGLITHESIPSDRLHTWHLCPLLAGTLFMVGWSSSVAFDTRSCGKHDVRFRAWTWQGTWGNDCLAKLCNTPSPPPATRPRQTALRGSLTSSNNCAGVHACVCIYVCVYVCVLSLSLSCIPPSTDELPRDGRLSNPWRPARVFSYLINAGNSV